MIRWNAASRFAFVMASAFLVFGSSCADVKCGANTVERNGVCTAVGSAQLVPSCAEGTIPDPNGSPTCIPKYTCGTPGSNTVLTDGGICKGTGGAQVVGDGGGVVMPTCPPQAPDEFCAVGRVATFLSDSKLPGMRDYLNDTSGACVRIVNPLGFIGGDQTPQGFAVDPATGAVSTSQEAKLDKNGIFIISGIPRNEPPFIAAIVDDCASAGSGTNKWAFSAVGGEQMSSALPIDLFNDYNTVAIAKETSDAWVSMAGKDLFAAGAYIACYRNGPSQTVGIEHVTPSASTGYINASNTIYFGDTLETLLPTRAFAEGTAKSGCAIVSPPGIAQHTGMGPPGNPIPWESILGGSIPQVYFVHRFRVR